MRSAATALDHLVLATPDLAATADWLAERTGVVAAAGGQHVGLGTRNMLCSLSSTSYLEIVGPDPDQTGITAPRPFGVDDLTEADIVAWAIGIAEMDTALTAARDHGHDPGPANAMHRRRPDGVLLSWTLTAPLSRTVPFLIDWGSSPHPAETASAGLELVELRARHPRPAELVSALGALDVALAIEQGGEGLVVELRGPLGSVRFG